MNIQVFLLSILIFAMPYNIFGENVGSLITMIAGLNLVLYQQIKYNSFSNPASISFNSKNLYNFYHLLLMLLAAFGFLTFFTTKTSDIFGSIHGFTIYINGIIFYKIFLNFNEGDKQNFYSYSSITSALLSVVFIIYQGLVLKIRIDGTIGYANSYSLLLIIGLYFNALSKRNTFSNLIDIMLMLSILYTGSRNSFIYLILFVAFSAFRELKGSKDLSILFSFVASLISFSILEAGGIIGLIFVPPVFYIVHILTNNLKYFAKNLKSASFAIIGIFSAIGFMIFAIGKLILSGSLFSRLTHLSFHTGVLQERLVYFQDAIKSISSNCFGNGINSFPYKQYIYQSAFYDVRFIHNSVLQIAYDIGIIAAILFIGIAILGSILILRSPNKNNKYFFMLYITIFLHSLLDFDLSFASIFILFISLIGFVNIKEIPKKIQPSIQSPNNRGIKVSYIVSIILVSFLGIYILSCDILQLLGNAFYFNESYHTALSFYKLEDKLEFKANPYTCISIAQVYNQEGNTNSLKNSIKFLKRAENLNSYNPITTGNMAFAYERLGKISQANNYYLKFLKKERFYYKTYTLYYEFLNKHYPQNSTPYTIGKVVMKKTYAKAIRDLNPGAMFMKTQLPNNFSKLEIK